MRGSMDKPMSLTTHNEDDNLGLGEASGSKLGLDRQDQDLN